MKNNAVWISIGWCFYFCLCAIISFAQETSMPVIKFANKSSAKNMDDDITLCLSFNYSPRFPPLKPDLAFVKLALWGDGRVLAGKFKSSEIVENSEIMNYEYYYAKTDSKRIETLLRSIETELQLKKHQTTMRDLGPGANTYLLRVHFAEGILNVETWEQYKNAEYFSRAYVWQEDQAAEKLLLSKFYAGWKVIKKDMLDLRDEIMAHPASKLVDVEWTGTPRRLIIHDKYGNLILECHCPDSLSDAESVGSEAENGKN